MRITPLAHEEGSAYLIIFFSHMLEPLVLVNTGASPSVASRPIFMKDYKTAIVTIASNGLTSGESFVARFKGSAEIAESGAPDFTVAKSPTNLWDYVQAIKVSDGTVIDGATGDSFSANDDVRIYEINVNGLTYLYLDLGDVVGTVTVLGKAMLYEAKN